MKQSHLLAYYLEDLWSKGFKLSDEEVRFIYFAKYSANASDWMAKQALKITLQMKCTFDGSFYISLLELIVHESVTNNKKLNHLLMDKGIFLTPAGY